MTTTHTPGPWYVGKHTDTYVGRIWSDKHLIATTAVPNGDDLRGHRTTKANARLMAEAPSMLEVLRDALAASDANCGDSLMNALCEARDILARVDKED
jgi:hypothetical protein